MTRLVWNQPGERFYETGVDRGVLYPRVGPGVPWNGLLSVSENVAGGDIEQLYFDGVKYLDVVANEDFQATLEAFSSPPEFSACDGSKSLSPGLFATQQPRKTFGLSYRTKIGNDLAGLDRGYKLHVVYGATAAPSTRSSQTLSNTPSLSSRQWTINAVPPRALSYKPTSHFVFDSTLMDPYLLQDIESFLYGREGSDPTLITQDDILAILANRITEPITEPI